MNPLDIYLTVFTSFYYFAMSQYLLDSETLKTQIRRDQSKLDCVMGEIKNYESNAINNSFSSYYKMGCHKKLTEELYPQKQALIQRIENMKMLLNSLN